MAHVTGLGLHLPHPQARGGGARPRMCQCRRPYTGSVEASANRRHRCCAWRLSQLRGPRLRPVRRALRPQGLGGRRPRAQVGDVRRRPLGAHAAAEVARALERARVSCPGDGLLPVPLTRCIQMHTPSPCWVCRLQH